MSVPDPSSSPSGKDHPLPPGQKARPDLPVRHYGPIPRRKPDPWPIAVGGKLADRTLTTSVAELVDDPGELGVDGMPARSLAVEEGAHRVLHRARDVRSDITPGNRGRQDELGHWELQSASDVFSTKLPTRTEEGNPWH